MTEKIENNVSEQTDNVLPQNILRIGENNEENKKIYILQSVYKQISKFTQNKTTNESGGMLVGTVIEEFGETNIIINGFIEAKHCEATPTTLKFTHETWEYVHKQIEKKYKKQKIVGWIHTHPDFGIFLSDYDKFIHQNFFNEDYQIAYVVDPVRKFEGFYFWIEGNIEKCKGFYVYDETGEQITVDMNKEKPELSDSIEKVSTFNFKNVTVIVFCIMIALLIFSNISTNQKLKNVEAQQQMLTESANNALVSMQQLIYEQSEKIQNLENSLSEAGIVIENEAPDTSNN